MIIDILTQAWVQLAKWYPPQHFDGNTAAEYFQQYVRNRLIWHTALAEPDGPGTHGTMVRITTAGDTLSDIEEAVASTVACVAHYRLNGLDMQTWRERWEEAKRESQETS